MNEFPQPPYGIGNDNKQPEHGTIITVRDIYDLLMTLMGKVDAALSTGQANSERGIDHEQRLRVLEAAQSAEKLSDHEVRLRNVERWRNRLPASVAVAVLSSITAVVIALLKAH